MPCASAAAVCDCPEASSTTTTGQPVSAAISALAPFPDSPGSGTPSNRPIEPSASAMSPPRAICAASTPAPIAHESRLKLSRPQAARWKAGSI